MEMMGMPTPAQNTEHVIEQQLESAKETLVHNCESISNTLIEKVANGEKYTAAAHALMARITHLLPDGTKIHNLDGRNVPLTSQIGTTVEELLKHIPQQDSATIEVIGAALTIQALVMCVGKQNWEKVRSFAEKFKSRLAF